MATSKKMLVNSTKAKKYTSLSELELNDKGSVYVLNATTGELSGQILISVPKKNGNGSDLVRIPKTFIPIDIAAQVTRSQLLESSEFRKTVTNGLIKLVTKEYAELLLATEEGREEKRRIDNAIQQAQTVVENSGVAEDEEDEYIDTESVSRDAKRASEKSGKGKAGVSVKLQTIVNSAAEENLSQADIVGKLLNYNGGNLTMPELSYLKKNYEDKPRIMKHLKTVYTALKKRA